MISVVCYKVKTNKFYKSISKNLLLAEIYYAIIYDLFLPPPLLSEN